jgi:hypothetical protein
VGLFLHAASFIGANKTFRIKCSVRSVHKICFFFAEVSAKNRHEIYPCHNKQYLFHPEAILHFLVPAALSETIAGPILRYQVGKAAIIY